MSRFVLSEDAAEDLQSIYVFSEMTWGATQAEKYLVELYALFELIAAKPLLGRLRTELAEGLRSFPHGPHVVFYMQWQTNLAIVRILHGSRDVEALFSEAGPQPAIDSSDKE